LLNERAAADRLLVPWMANNELATSVLVYGEVVEYILSRPDFEVHHQRLWQLLRVVYPVALSYPVLEQYARIRLQMRPPHGPGLIGDIDTLIAASALERDLIIVTTDSDFLRVPNLGVILLDRVQLTIRDQHLPSR
jgi:predicted nucleic acid-binding protein